MKQLAKAASAEGADEQVDSGTLAEMTGGTVVEGKSKKIKQKTKKNSRDRNSDGSSSSSSSSEDDDEEIARPRLHRRTAKKTTTMKEDLKSARRNRCT